MVTTLFLEWRVTATYRYVNISCFTTETFKKVIKTVYNKNEHPVTFDAKQTTNLTNSTVIVANKHL